MNSYSCFLFEQLPSVLRHCFGIRKSIWPVKIEQWDVVVICLERGADCLHIVQLMPLHPKTPSPLASFKSRLVLPFWYWLIEVVLEKRPLNRCSSCCSLNNCHKYEDRVSVCLTAGHTRGDGRTWSKLYGSTKKPQSQSQISCNNLHTQNHICCELYNFCFLCLQCFLHWSLDIRRASGP